MRFIRFSILAVMLSCGPGPEKEDRVREADESFKAYIGNTFNRDLPEERAYYYIIPTNACIGCVKEFIRNFYLNHEKPGHYLIINRNNLDVLNGDRKNVLIDTNNQIDRLPMRFQNPVLIISERQMVTLVYRASPDNIDSLDLYVK